MRKFLFVSLLILTIGCKSRKISADSPDKFVIENLAEIATSENLKRLFPDAAIEEGTDIFDEGIVKRPYSILYPGTRDEAILTWNDDERTQLHRIRIEKDGRWKTSQGIEIGTTYRELREKNGPLFVYGFGWDYSGAVDWNDGELADTRLRVFLAPKETPPNKYYGDKILNVSPEELEALELSVQGIMYQGNE